MTSVALLPLEMLSNTFFFLSRNICSRDLSGWCSGQSHDSSGVTKQHATHAWWYTVVGVVVRCFVGDSNGRTVSNFVMNCGAASLLDHQNCCCGGGGGRFQRRGLVSLWCSTKQIVIAKFQVFMFIFKSGVWNACIILFMYLFIFFPSWLKKDRSNVNRFFCIPRFGRRQYLSVKKKKKKDKLEHLFSQESGYNLMPYDLHPFLIFCTSRQSRQKKGSSTTKQFDQAPCLQAEASGGTTTYPPDSNAQ